MQRRRWNASRKTGLVSTVSAIALMVEKPILMSLAQYGTRPHRIRSRARAPALASYRTIGRLSVGATFKLGAILIADTSVSSFARPHICHVVQLYGGHVVRVPSPLDEGVGLVRIAQRNRR